MTESIARSTELPVAIVGAGFSGLAAAWAAVRAGARVLVVQDRPGSSALYSGLVDGERGAPELSELAAALGLTVNERRRVVATREGVVRPTRGRDSALLDLEALAGRRIAVADVGRDDWDARLLAPSWEASAWARETGTTFQSVPVAVLSAGAERRIASHDFAKRFDTTDGVNALAEALSRAAPEADAWLTGPWLGVATDVAAGLSARLARPVGETSSAPGGVAGARFELRREALLADLGVERLQGRAYALSAESGALELELGDDDRRHVRACVLALGGVAAGGIELASRPGGVDQTFRLSIRAPVALELDAEVFEGVSSVAGVSFVRFGLGLVERVGVHVKSGFRASNLPIFACGDAVAARPRTVLDALWSGIEAGRGAGSGGL